MRVETVAERRAWRGLLAGHPAPSLQQGWAYGEAVAAGSVGRHRFVARGADGAPLAVAQVAERRFFGGLRMAVLMRGPLWLGGAPSAADEAALLEALRGRLGGAVLLWTPEDADAADRRHGFRRVMTGYTTPWLDLARPANAIRAGFEPRWRNRLVQAEAGRLRAKTVRSGPLLDWLIAANEAYRKRVGYEGPAPPFLHRLCAACAPEGPLVLVAQEGSEPVAGIVVLRHGAAATYLVGCTSPRGRELRAHHLLLWRAIGALQDEGVRALDLGGIETVNAAGIARFKLGLGGRVVTYAGTYLVPPRLRL